MLARARASRPAGGQGRRMTEPHDEKAARGDTRVPCGDDSGPKCWPLVGAGGA
jgi:hypothetical protein